MFLEYKAQFEHHCPLLADDLFRNLSPKSFASLAKIKQTKQFEKGVRFFSKGDSARCVYILQKGKAHLLLTDESKDKHIERLIAPNEIFGLTEAIMNLHYETDAEAITPCTFEFIEREDLLGFLRGKPEVCLELVKLLGLNFQKSYKLFFSSIN